MTRGKQIGFFEILSKFKFINTDWGGGMYLGTNKYQQNPIVLNVQNISSVNLSNNHNQMVN